SDGGSTASGWSIDDVIILEGVFAAWSPEGFESGIGGWWADNGAWEVGPATSNPATAHGGSQLAGTTVSASAPLNGFYENLADSRLISPPVSLSASPTGGKLWLSFYHWINCYGGDTGQLEVSVAGGPWQVLSIPFTN